RYSALALASRGSVICCARYWPKADIPSCTAHGKADMGLHMSAFDPKRTRGCRWNYFMGSELHVSRKCPTGTRKMAAGDQYRIKAAEFHGRARSEASPRIRVEFENLAKAHMRLAEQADWNERVRAMYSLCRQVRADAKSKSGLYEPPRPRSPIQTEQVASIRKWRRGKRPRTNPHKIAQGRPSFSRS